MIGCTKTTSWMICLSYFALLSTCWAFSTSPMKGVRESNLVLSASRICKIGNRLRYGVMQDLIHDNVESNGSLNVGMKLSQSKAFLAGDLFSWVRYIFFASTDAYKRGFNEMMQVFDLKDMWTICLFVFIFPRIVKIFYNCLYSKILGRGNHGDDSSTLPSFKNSTAFGFANLLRDFGRIGGLIYGLELIAEFIDGVVRHEMHITKGFKLTESFFTELPRLMAVILYGLWGARSLSTWKRNFITQYLSNEKNFSIGAQFRDRKALIPLYDRFATTFIYLIYLIYVVDISPLNLSYILRSIVTLGGISSFVIGLALQGPAKQLISGIIILLSGKFHTGEKIKADSTIGKVVNIGWTDTTLEGVDLVKFRIPNEKLLAANVSNISRTPSCYVKVMLDMDINEINNVQNIIDAITKEIENCIPDSEFMVTDGNALEVLWTDIERGVIKILVKCHLRCKPSSAKYNAKRQEILFAIARATRSTQAKFAPIDYS